MRVAIVILAIAAPVTGVPLILLPIHLVWLELIVHPVSAIVFQAEPAAELEVVLKSLRLPAEETHGPVSVSGKANPHELYTHFDERRFSAWFAQLEQGQRTPEHDSDPLVHRHED